MEMEEIYGDLPVLETERLILRKITQNDLEDMFSYASQPEVTRFVTWNTHQSLADTQTFVDYVLHQYKNKKIAPWGMEYKQTGKLIGTIDFVSWNMHHKMAEIGYVIHPSLWGKGITTEAATKLIQFGFTKMDLIRIQARCFVENMGSQRVMEKCGMKFEGIIRKSMYMKEKHWDLKMYSILKEEFFGVQQAQNES